MDHKRNDAALAVMTANDPWRRVTMNYYWGTINGFNDENIVKSLEDIALTLRATGYHGNALNDYNRHDFDHSWWLNEIYDDI